jgi:fatty-acid desaturase
LPFRIGYLGDTLVGAVMALLWAGIVRVGVTHNITWSITSIGHRLTTPVRHGRQHECRVPAPLTMGESALQSPVPEVGAARVDPISSTALHG